MTTSPTFSDRSALPDPVVLSPLDGEAGYDVFAAIRKIMPKMEMAIGRLVLSTREHTIAIELPDKGSIKRRHVRQTLSALTYAFHAAAYE